MTDFYWQDWEFYRVVIVFLDLTDAVIAYNFKLVQIMMTAKFSNTVGICHLCMWYIGLPRL